MFKWVLIPTALVLLVVSMAYTDTKLAFIAIGLIAGSVPVGISQWMIALHARCPLCLAPPMAHRRCSRHKNARSLFGSYRLMVACSVLARKRFSCPYCGETTAIEVRRNPLARGR